MFRKKPEYCSLDIYYFVELENKPVEIYSRDDDLLRKINSESKNNALNILEQTSNALLPYK